MSKRTSGRIKRPASPKELLDLAAAIYQKHIADGPGSPLYNLEGINWDEIGPMVAQASEHHNKAEEHKRKMEEEYRSRDNLVTHITQANNATKALLKAMFPQNPKKLGDWGYDIDDSAPTKKNGQ